MTEKEQLRRLKAFVNSVLDSARTELHVDSYHIDSLASENGIYAAVADENNFYGFKKADWLKDENENL